MGIYRMVVRSMGERAPLDWSALSADVEIQIVRRKIVGRFERDGVMESARIRVALHSYTLNFIVISRDYMSSEDWLLF